MKGNPCKRFDRFGPNGEKLYKNKIVFTTEEDAVNYAKRMNIMNIDHLIHKFMAYHCPKCGSWHICKNRVPISDKERMKIKNQMS